MTFFSAIPVPETQIGIAKETTRGTYAAPTYWIPVMGPKYKPDLKLLPDEGLRGSMVSIYDEIPSLRNDSHGWDQYLYLDSFPVLVRALLGSKDTKTTAPTSTTLKAEALAGATEVEVAATVAEGDYIVIGSGAGNIETHLIKKTATTKLTLAYPLSFTHASGVAVTGLTKHEFSLLNNADSEGNQPASCTIVDEDGEEHMRALMASQLDSLSISGSADALPKATVNWFSNASVTPESPPSPSYTTVEAVPDWSGYVSIGGTAITYLTSWSWDLKRGVKPIPAITGTQNYYQFFAGPLEATAKLTVIENREATWLKAYEEGATEEIDFTLNDVKNGYAFNLHSTSAKFTSGELDRSKEWVEVPLEVQLLPTSTDALAGGVAPIKITVANAVTTEY